MVAGDYSKRSARLYTKFGAIHSELSYRVRTSLKVEGLFLPRANKRVNQFCFRPEHPLKMPVLMHLTFEHPTIEVVEVLPPQD